MKRLVSHQISLRLAVIIDGENIAPSCFSAIFEAAELIGQCVSWQVFGDFSNKSHEGWVEVCKTGGLVPVLQLPMISGKNTTDIAITVAAMDILHDSTLTALVLASNDSDFLPLVRRLRAGGIDVHGIGNRQVGLAVTSSYTTYKIIDFIKKAPAPSKPEFMRANPSKPLGLNDAVLLVLKNASMTLSQLGKELRHAYPEVASQLGKGRLKKCVESSDMLKFDGLSVVRK